MKYVKKKPLSNTTNCHDYVVHHSVLLVPEGAFRGSLVPTSLQYTKLLTQKSSLHDKYCSMYFRRSTFDKL